jgi:hypothetical protein
MGQDSQKEDTGSYMNDCKDEEDYNSHQIVLDG